MRYPWCMPQEQSALCGQNMAHPVVSLVWKKQEGTGPAVTNPKGFLSLWTSLLKEYGSRTNRKLSTIGKSFCSFTYEKKKKKKTCSALPRVHSCVSSPFSRALSGAPPPRFEQKSSGHPLLECFLAPRLFCADHFYLLFLSQKLRYAPVDPVRSPRWSQTGKSSPQRPLQLETSYRQRGCCRLAGQLWRQH